MRLHSTYKFKHSPEILVYVGKVGVWHQFEKFDARGKVWSELLDDELSLLEPVAVLDPTKVCKEKTWENLNINKIGL